VGHRGHKDDPLRKILGLLRHGVEHLTDKQQAKIIACLDAGDPNGEVNLAWQRYQQVRSIYHAGAETGRTICQKVLDSFLSCPIPEVARLGGTLKAWRQQVLAYFDTTDVSDGGTEAINLHHRKGPPPGPWLQGFRALHSPDPARRLRPAPLPRTPNPRIIPKSPQSGPGRRLTRSLQAVLTLTLALYIAEYLYSVLKAGVKAVEWDRTTAPRLGHRLAATPCHLTRP
jgi:hypothetical protein